MTQALSTEASQVRGHASQVYTGQYEVAIMVSLCKLYDISD